MEKNETKQAKTQVFNVIILDKSGSMESIRKAAVDGFNETLAGIKKAQERFADTQEHFVSLLTFCNCDKRYVFDKVPVANTRPLTMVEYQPCCCTPLYDAMGFTLTSMRQHVSKIEDAVVVVTIITDGLENASVEYTGAAVKKLVEELKGEGWTFTYMGANQDAVEIAFTLSIRNARNFSATAHDTMACMAKDASTRMNFFSRLDSFKKDVESCTAMSSEMRHARYTAMADEAFDEVESKDGDKIYELLKRMIIMLRRLVEQKVPEKGEFPEVYVRETVFGMNIGLSHLILKVTHLKDSENERYLEIAGVNDPYPYGAESVLGCGTKQNILAQLQEDGLVYELMQKVEKLAEDIKYAERHPHG
jgi:hypothetical protein